jgi:carbon-monoxide dehydrogenase medium subunit
VGLSLAPEVACNVKPAPFSYHRPSSLAEALALLDHMGPRARLIAGGQSMVPMLNLRLTQTEQLIDLNDLTEWARIRDLGQQIEIGFLTRHAQLVESALLKQHCPLVPEMAQTIAHHAIRNRGTLGGSLSHADPAAQLTLMAMALDAQITLRSLSKERTVRAADFFQAAMTTSLRSDELLLKVTLPKFESGEVGAFQMFSRRSGDYALLAVALTLSLEGDEVRAMRIAVSGASSVPQRLSAVESLQAGQATTPSWVQKVAQSVRDAVHPDEDDYIPASYRKQLAMTLTTRALHQALERRKHSTA